MGTLLSPTRRGPSPTASTTEAESPGRIRGYGPVGVVDIGSNSVRLVVYERLARSPTPLFNEKVLAGLGAGVGKSGRLSDDAMEKALAALRRFAALARQMQVVDLAVLATAATRDATNGADFIAKVRDICGCDVVVLSGEEEARYAALGVVDGFQKPDGVAGDLGGGSLEVTDIRGEDLGQGETFPLGGLRLSEDAGGDIKAARKLAREALEASNILPGLEGRTFYAIGGTWRSIAKLHMRQTGYPLRVMHGYTLEVDKSRDFLKSLYRTPVGSIDSIEVVSKQRQPLLSYGGLVLSELVRAGKPARIVISALGLREGFLYSRLSSEEQARDPLLAAAGELALLRSRSPAHCEELIPWTGEAMVALGIDETEEEARLRAASCLLADIGWRAHPDYRGEQSLNIISNAAFVGVDHPGRAYLGLSVFYRHSGLSDDELGPGLREVVTVRYRERARALAAAFRVAYLVSASMPGVMPRTAIRREGSELQLVLPPDIADLAGGRLEQRLRQLANLAGLESRIVTEV
ncbi:Ppx/GppA phosphatase family protein [Afifella pfennigii]|uniref:Ppx/GppA phosphatase family protein n=1 Tax=Afifella pfennigii TaxID=209897 RepID=UPI001FE01FCF|nr:Ppx/GppA phosphatase family protein [Afifella pfennigii]